MSEVLSALPARALTLDDLRLLPDDGRRYEIIDGSLIVSPPPSVAHQYTASNLYDVLRAGAPAGLRPVTGGAGILASTGRFLIPDVLVVRDPAGRSGGAGFHPADVVLVAEIVSPSNAATDLILKRALYEAHGIAHYWIVDIRAEPTVHALRLVDGRYTETRVGQADALSVIEPFAVTIRPRDLTR